MRGGKATGYGGRVWRVLQVRLRLIDPLRGETTTVVLASTKSRVSAYYRNLFDVTETAYIGHMTRLSAGGGALPVTMSIIRSSAKPTTTATITFECAVPGYDLIKK